MLNTKLIGLLALVLGVVACEPLPVYPPDGRRQGPPPRRAPDPELRDYRDARYFGDESRGRYDARNDDRYNDRLGDYDDHRGDGGTSGPGSYPTAERTGDPNRVLSPYAPYNVIDVEGFRPGQLAKDPSNGKIFRIP